MVSKQRMVLCGVCKGMMMLCGGVGLSLHDGGHLASEGGDIFHEVVTQLVADHYYIIK
jgi:hypothetical protein